ncbi:DNA-directed RNA polymerase [Caerostris darwini]|uniref:DNA-directed RNA polymerase n=1 Tax=Caerostris darwini TaxID=1538125 RepID=A0AAV4Q8R3_9ARAC|nr:DNA-directed RNA polymerase [Caerostris darwini]
MCCCGQFYYNGRLTCYPVQSIAVRTSGYAFLLPQLKRMLQQATFEWDQDFLVIPDPIYWQVASTLVYEKVMKFVQGLPVTSRTEIVQPSSKSDLFYKQIQEVPLNYGSLNRRSCGKATLIRQIAFGKRCQLALRGLIVADGSLSANHIRIPHSIVTQFGLKNKYVMVVRMPTLGPANAIALQVLDDPKWTCPCFGFPLERTESLNADFDGDEINIYLVMNHQSQAECMSLLSAKAEMSDFVMGLKLAPSQDMLVAYHMFYDSIDFLPYKHRDLRRTFQVIYDLKGSAVTYECFEKMRQFYMDALENKTCFALTLEEMKRLLHYGQGSLKEFKTHVQKEPGCLKIQILSGAKGSFEHVYQMFGAVGYQNGYYVQNCFWNGLTAREAVAHAVTATEALSNSSNIWEPGYGYSKSVYNLQSLHVDYLGRLVDGTQVLEKDVLDVLHHTDVMSEDTCAYLLEEVLVLGKQVSTM